MKRISVALLLVALATTAHAFEEQQKASPSLRLGGAVCLAGLTECFPLSSQMSDIAQSGDMKLAAAMASDAPGYPLPITTSNPARNVLNGAINECTASSGTMPDMTVCLANQGYLVTSYRW